MLRASYAVFGCSCLVAVKAGRQRYDLIIKLKLSYVQTSLSLLDAFCEK